MTTIRHFAPREVLKAFLAALNIGTIEAERAAKRLGLSKIGYQPNEWTVSAFVAAVLTAVPTEVAARRVVDTLLAKEKLDLLGSVRWRANSGAWVMKPCEAGDVAWRQRQQLTTRLLAAAMSSDAEQLDRECAALAEQLDKEETLLHSASAGTREQPSPKDDSLMAMAGSTPADGSWTSWVGGGGSSADQVDVLIGGAAHRLEESVWRSCLDSWEQRRDFILAQDSLADRRDAVDYVVRAQTGTSEESQEAAATILLALSEYSGLYTLQAAPPTPSRQQLIDDLQRVPRTDWLLLLDGAYVSFFVNEFGSLDEYLLWLLAGAIGREESANR